MDKLILKSESLPANGHMASVNDIEIYYEDYGEGVPLILLHGFIHYSQYWKPFVDDFANHYRVILVDLRGHGRSTNPTNQYTHRQAALDVFALLDTLGIDKFIGIGFSAGGAALLHMATQQRSRIQNMVLVASAASYFTEESRAIMGQLTPDSPVWDWDELRQRHVYGDEQILALITQLNNFKDSYDDLNFTKPYLSTITAKTLIIHGDRDPLLPVSMPVEMYTAIPDSSLWIIPNGGHTELLTGHETEFSQTVLKFLRD